MINCADHERSELNSFQIQRCSITASFREEKFLRWFLLLPKMVFTLVSKPRDFTGKSVCQSSQKTNETDASLVNDFSLAGCSNRFCQLGLTANATTKIFCPEKKIEHEVKTKIPYGKLFQKVSVFFFVDQDFLYPFGQITVPCEELQKSLRKLPHSLLHNTIYQHTWHRAFGVASGLLIDRQCLVKILSTEKSGQCVQNLRNNAKIAKTTFTPYGTIPKSVLAADENPIFHALWRRRIFFFTC